MTFSFSGKAHFENLFYQVMRDGQQLFIDRFLMLHKNSSFIYFGPEEKKKPKSEDEEEESEQKKEQAKD